MQYLIGEKKHNKGLCLLQGLFLFSQINIFLGILKVTGTIYNEKKKETTMWFHECEYFCMY